MVAAAAEDGESSEEDDADNDGGLNFEEQARAIKQESKDEVNPLTTLKQQVCDVRPLNVLEQKLHTILEGHKQAGRVMAYGSPSVREKARARRSVCGHCIWSVVSISR